jgi:hypothetical protein
MNQEWYVSESDLDNILIPLYPQRYNNWVSIIYLQFVQDDTQTRLDRYMTGAIREIWMI